MLFKDNNHKQKVINVIREYDLITFSCVLYVLPLWFYYEKEVYHLFYPGLLSVISSFLYHYTYEQSFVLLLLDMISSVICLCIFILDIIVVHYEDIFMIEFYSIGLIVCIYFYICGTGRKETRERSDDYLLYHFGWHMSIFMLSFIHSTSQHI